MMGNWERTWPSLGRVGKVPEWVWRVTEVLKPERIWEMRSRPTREAALVEGE